MDIQARKVHFVQEFLRVADEEIIIKLEKILRIERRKILEKEIKPMTLKHFNEIIDQSEADISNERVTEARNLLQKIDKW